MIELEIKNCEECKQPMKLSYCDRINNVFKKYPFLLKEDIKILCKENK